jgi:sugar phosphate isomerase/epimerase
MEVTSLRFAFSTLGCPDWPVERVVGEAKRLGYDGVEIRGIRRVLDLSEAPELKPSAIEGTRRLFSDAGIPIVQVDTSASFCWTDQVKLEAAYDETARHIEIACQLGAPLVRVFGGDIPKGDTREKWAGVLTERLKRVAGLAEKGGVTVAVETHDAWARYADTAAVVSAVGSPRVRVLWDVGNGWLLGDRFEDEAPLRDGRIAHVHIKDHAADGRLVPLGAGVIPLPRVLQQLQSIGFDGYVSLEWEKMWHPELAEPETALPAAIEYLRRNAPRAR